MNYLLPLILSALVINIVHFYLLLAYKKHKRFTISEHAALTSKSHLIYIAGNLVCGLLFLIFARRYYVQVLGLNNLFYLSFITVVFEYLQALIPAKGKTNRLHLIAALSMWFSFLTLGILTIVFVPASLAQKVLSCSAYLVLFTELRKSYKNLTKLYKYQMAMVNLFYLSMFVVVL